MLWIEHVPQNWCPKNITLIHILILVGGWTYLEWLEEDKDEHVKY